MEYLPYIWLGLAALFAITEAVTLGLTTIWFSIGALFGMLSAIFGWNPYLQIVVFLIVSIILLWFTRPIARRYLKIGGQRTNADRIIGEEGIVIESITEFKTGQVKVLGQIWTAVSRDEKLIETDERVIIIDIEGVKLVVSKIK